MSAAWLRSVSFVSPMDLSVAQSDGCGLAVDVFLKPYDASVGNADAEAIAVLVGQINHHRDFGIVEV